MCADAFVPVHKWVIFDQAKAKPSCFLLKRWINVFPAKGLERGAQRRIQHTLIAQSIRTSGRCNELFVQAEYLWFRQADYLASSS